MKKKQLFLYLLSFLFITTQAQIPTENSNPLPKTAFKFLTNNFNRSETELQKIYKVEVSKTLNVPVAGTLNNLLTIAEKNTITNLTLTGSIDARDFKILRDSMPVLAELDIQAVTISSYSGGDGTSNMSTFYPANEIPESAFYNSDNEDILINSRLTSILLPTTATSIGIIAFVFCKSLTSISISTKINKIGLFAFVGCSAKINVDQNNPNYSSIDGILYDKTQTTLIQCPISIPGNYNIPTTVKSIGMYGFSFCDNLQSVNIPSNVISIGMYAFTSCSGLVNVDVNNPNYLSQEGVLFNKSAKTLIQCGTSKSGSYIIPATVDSIGENSFYNCNLLTAVTLPASINYIGDFSFYDCTGLSSITVNSLPVSLTSEYYVFNGVDMNTCILNVPFGAKAAYESASLWRDFVNIVENPHGLILSTNKLILNSTSGSNYKIKITTNDAWNVISNQSWLQLNPQSGWGNDTIVCTAEANTTFENRIAVITVTTDGVPAQTITVTQIGLPKAVNIRSGGLFTSLTSAELTSTYSLKITGTIDARDFKTMRDNMPNLAILDISEATITAYTGLEGPVEWINTYDANRIPDYSFYVVMSSQHHKLADINMPKNITAIGMFAFYSCKELTDIIIPNSVTFIGEVAFGSCINLINVTLPDKITSIERQTFSNCGFSNFTIPNTVKIIGRAGFSYCSNLKSINMPISVTTIETSAFENCNALVDLKIGNSVKSIGNSAFRGCTGLTNLVIPNSVKLLDGYAFQACINLNTVQLSDSLTSIGNGCFFNCEKLTEINIPTTVTSISNLAFGFCKGLKSLIVNTDIPINLSSSDGVFTGVDNSNCILNVPFGAKSAYAVANQWKDFVNIIEMTTALPTLLDSKISIYPNPVKESFRIEGMKEISSVIMTDLNGKQILTRQVNEGEHISVSNLPKGIYIVKIFTSLGTVERKLLKK